MTDGEASSSDRIPPRELARLLLRTWPYLRPQLHHIILLFGLIFTGEALLMGSAFLGADLFSNKVLVGEKLEPEQARLFLLDDSYVREADTPPTAVGDDDAEPPELLTDGQRRNVRNGVFLLFGLAWYLRFLIGQCRDYYQVWILQRINQALRVAMIEKAEHLSLRYHSHAQTGDAIYRVYQDSAMITSVVSGVILFPIEAIGYLVFGLVMITIFSPAIGLLLVAGFIPGVWYVARYTPQLQRRSLAARQTNARLTSRIQEAFASIRVVKANLAERAMAGRFDGDSVSALDAAFYFRVHLYVMWIGIWVLTGFLMLLALYLMAGWTVRGEATFVAGAIAIAGFTVWNLGAFQYTQGRLEFTAAYGHVLAAVWGNLQDLTMGLRRAYLLLDLEPDVADRADAVALPARIERIRLDEVSFSYVTLVPVLEGVTLTASRGTVTAIVGA
ncbi:MAG: ABC transporter ATP-binding protein, partial [Gammaproteobacteria bacterium]|nr:ABC transporter ATP-binding protein [Gammaproteobacteria bacterium]